MTDLKVGSHRKVGPAPENVVNVTTLYYVRLKMHKNALSNYGNS